MNRKHILGIEFLEQNSKQRRVVRLLTPSFQQSLYVGRSSKVIIEEPADLAELVQVDGQRIDIVHWAGVTDTISANHFMLSWDKQRSFYVVQQGKGTVQIKEKHKFSQPDQGIYYLPFVNAEIYFPAINPIFCFSPNYLSGE